MLGTPTAQSESLRLVSFTSPMGATPISPGVSPQPNLPDQDISRQGSISRWLRQCHQRWMLLCLGTMLPICMIVAGMIIQRHVRMLADAEAEKPVELPANVPQRYVNMELLNRTCPARLVSHFAAESTDPLGRSIHGKMAGDMGTRVVIGAGFLASGLNSLSTVLQRVPGACMPTRANLGFWTNVDSAERTRGLMGRVDTGGDAKAWRLPDEALTRARYLHDSLRMGAPGAKDRGRGRGCTVPWELTERYANAISKHASPPAVCTPLAIRHHLPNARVVLMMGDPVQRAHAQQSLWLHNRCFRDAREATIGRSGSRARFAKGAMPGCEKVDANAQFRLELRCLRSCHLRVDSPILQLQQCAASCGRSLRNSFPCKSNCPYLSLINSHYALMLPLWLRTFPCDHLLLLDRNTFFDANDADASSSFSRSKQAHIRRRARLRQRHSGSHESTRIGHASTRVDSRLQAKTHQPPPMPSPPPPPPPPPSPSLPASQLMSLLRFVGMSAENATHLAHKLRRSPLVAPAFGTAHNPIEPELQRELDDYFRPFQEHLHKMISAHHKCHIERLGLKRKPIKVVGAALARAG